MFFSWQVIKNKSYIFIDQWEALRCHFPHTHKYISNIDLWFADLALCGNYCKYLYNSKMFLSLPSLRRSNHVYVIISEMHNTTEPPYLIDGSAYDCDMVGWSNDKFECVLSSCGATYTM